MTNQNLLNEIAQLTDNRVQLEKVLASLPGDNYSQEEIKSVLNDLKAKAKADYQRLDADLGVNQEAINIAIDKFTPLIGDLSTSLKEWNKNKESITSLKKDVAGLTEKVSAIQKSQLDSSAFYEGEIKKIEQKIIDENSRFNNSSVVPSNPVGGLLDSPTYIQEIINDFTAARNNADSLSKQWESENKLWESKRQYWVSEYKKFAAKKQWPQAANADKEKDLAIQKRNSAIERRDIFADFLNRFNNVINTLTILKGVSQVNDSYISNGVKFSQFDAYKANLQNASRIYSTDLVNLYQGIFDEINNQKERKAKGLISVDVQEHITKYIKNKEVFIYKENAELQGESLQQLLNSSPPNNLDSVKNELIAASQRIVDGYRLEIKALRDSNFLKNAQYQKSINDTNFELNQKQTDITQKDKNYSTLSAQIEAKNQEIKVLYNTYQDLLVKNGKIAEDWKQLLRNESHYFLDEAELHLYQDAYNDFNKQAEKINTLNQKLGSIQNLDTDLVLRDIVLFRDYIGNKSDFDNVVNRLLSDNQTFYQVLNKNIIWAKDRQETIALIGSSNQKALAGLIVEIDNLIKNGVTSSLPLSVLSSNLRKIQSDRNNLLTSYDDLQAKISEINLWLQQSQSFGGNSSKDQQIKDNYLIQLQVAKSRLSIFPSAQFAVNKIDSNFKQETGELTSNWNQAKTLFDELITLGANKNSKVKDLEKKNKYLTDLEKRKTSLEAQKTQLEEQIKNNLDLITSLTQQIKTKDAEITSAEKFLTTFRNSETTAKAKVDTYGNAQGGFFKWENGELVARTTRIANYRQALNEYYLAKKNVATQQVIVNTLKSQRESINNQKTALEQKTPLQISHGEGPILVREIEILKTEITALENDLKTINQGITDKSLSFLSQIANTGTEFQDIGWTLKIEELLGEKLLGLGLLITQSDINFFAEEVKPTVEEFIKAISNRFTDLQGLNSPLNSLVSNVAQQDYTKIDPLVNEFVKSFQKLLNKQKQDLQTWQTEQKTVPSKFQDSYETAQDKVGEILLWRRIQTEAELGNIEEVISILNRRLVIGETTADLILDKSPVQASKLNQLITEQVVLDIKSQENLLKEADSFNKLIDKDVIFLKGLATKLFNGFDLSLSKVLSDYLRDKQQLTQGIDIKAILTDRLTAIEDSVDSVQDAIDLFQQKINSQGDLLQKIQGISRELELSEKGQDFLKVKNLLGDQDNLNLSNLNQGVNDLKSLLQFLLTKKDSFSTELNQSLTANLQKLDSINALTNQLKTFADREKQIEDKLVEIASKSANLLQKGIENNGLTNEKKELYFFSEEKPENDQEKKTVIDKIISGKIKPKNIGNVYFITPEADTWEKIQDFAKSIGGNLVTINSEGEQQFILRRIFAATPTGKIEAGTQYWIGYTDKTKESQWGWVSGQSNGFENWGDRDNGSKLDYAYINRFGLWQTASGEKKLRGIIELDLNSLTIEQLRLESERKSLYTQIKDYLDKHSPDYKSILASLTSTETALNKLLADAGIGDLNVLSVIGSIRDKYQESSEFLAEIDSDVKTRKASAEAHIKTAEFYEKSAQEYLSKHKELKKTLKDELGFDLLDNAISTETRKTFTRGLLGKKEISVQITHLNSYWLYYEDFTNRAKAARKSAYKILGRDGDLDNPQYNLNIAESLNDQLLKAQAVNSAWKIANDQANVVEGRLNQLRSLINVINLGNVQSQEYQNAINNLQTLLPDLKNQLTDAQQKATNAYQTVKQQWSNFNQSADRLQQVYNELIPLKSQYKAENLSLLGKLEDAKTWVTQKRQSLALQLESVNDVGTRLEEFVNSTNQKPSIATILNSVQKLLIHNESLLKDRLAALGEHDEALDAQQTLLLKELELVDAYFDNGGREYSLLRQELEQAQNSLQELQLLAQEALDSSTILTKNIDQITIYLDSVNDEYLTSVKDSHKTLKDLVNSLNFSKGKFEESKKVIDNINTAESDIIKLLEKIKNNGETRVTKILEMAKLRGLAVAADIFWQDFTDLLSDTGNFFAGGIATPEDKKLAKSFRKELMTQRTLKRSAEVDANQAGLAIKQAQAQQAVLEAKIKESQASYDKLRSEIANSNQTTEAQQETLQKLQLRQAALERLQDVTTGIIKSLLDIQQVNLKLAELEIRYAESFASDIEGNKARQIALEAVALNYQKQRLATQVEIYQRADIESTLQASLIEIGRNLGLEITPIVEVSNNQEAIIDLQEQIDRLQKSPLLPDDIQQLLNKVNQDINDALTGKEASEIKQNIKDVTKKLIDQQSEYRKELEQLATEAEDDSQLIKTAETDLKSAANLLWNSIQTRENYLTDKSILSDQVLNVLTEVRLAESANKISTELAQKARTIFADILEQRQIEREARQKTLFDFLLEATGTVLQIAATFATAGSTLALTIGVMAAVNQAIIAIRNGDVLKAIYYGVQSALLGAGAAIKSLPDGASVLGVSEDTLVKIIGKSGKALSNIYKGGMAIATGDYIDAIKEIYKLGATINVIDDIKDWGFLKEVSGWLEGLPLDYIGDKLKKGKFDGLGSFKELFIGVGFRILEGSLRQTNYQLYLDVAPIIAITEFGISAYFNAEDYKDSLILDKLVWWGGAVGTLYRTKQMGDILSGYMDMQKRLEDIKREKTDWLNWLNGYNVSTDVSIKWNTDGSSFSTEDPIFLDGIESKIENLQEIKLSQPQITPDNRLPTTIIIHGEDDSLYQQWTPELGSRIKRLEKVANNQESNVLIINWSNLLATEYIDTFNYSERIQTKVDKSAQALAQKLFGEYNLDPSKVNIIGHGLGYQLATKIGQWTLENKNQKLKEIVVLEPTLSNQQSQIVNPDRIAQKVEVIRSDYQGLYHYVFPTLKQNLGSTRIGSGYLDGKTTDSLDYYLPESVNKFFYGTNHFDAIQVYLSFLDSQINSANQSQETFEQYLQRLSQSLDNNQTSNLNSDPTGLDFSSVNERLTLNYFSGHPTLSGYYLSSPFYAAPGVEKQFYTFADFSQDIPSYAEKFLKFKITRVTEATGGNWQHFNPLSQAWQDLEVNQEIIFNTDSQIRYQSANLSKESAFLDWEILAVQGQEENDYLPSITIAVSPTSVTEDGTPNLIYTFTRTGVTTNALTVNYTVGGTATIGTDYTGIATAGTTKTVTFAAGSSTATVTVDPTADTTIESDETVALTLASGTGYTIGTTNAVTGTITNDDFPSITLAVSPASVLEDGTPNLVYTFTRTGATTSALTVNYSIAGTADATDYTGATPGTGKTITFAAGSA
ncbi:MAG: lectin-like protein, partial [Cuspidothrix sp.]